MLIKLIVIIHLAGATNPRKLIIVFVSGVLTEASVTNVSVLITMQQAFSEHRTTVCFAISRNDSFYFNLNEVNFISLCGRQLAVNN